VPLLAYVAIMVTGRMETVPLAAAETRILVVVLRFGAALTGSAFLAMLLPVEWMAATHRWLGLGEFPGAPITDYLTRSVAALYGFHGVLLFLISRDPVRYRVFVRYVGWMNVLFGICLLLVDLHAGLPRWWVLGEGPPVTMLGAGVLYLSRKPSVPDGLSPFGRHK
jgi:hypothetical protein